ncbi:hypothetical protein HGP17_13500 [Rhizobium sp. P38BS-XIX]|uniref:VOC family protein n=1 Tax=Rhizobium sp. P38BS-XIX TaxID=2726740 RepID=UPI0014568AAA|nr:VOC family protein [Rhizobium sp. P38BS-XIX]NLR97828.1 hypothetical protein [Rhizobium sp. P38BS-XIX]
MKIRQHLWFQRDMEAAIEFYTSIIPGSSIGWISNILTSAPNGPAGSSKFAGFTLGGRPFMGFEAGPFDSSDHGSMITMTCDTRAEADRLCKALSKGGSVENAGHVRDAWGVYWQFLVAKRDEHAEAPGKAPANDSVKTRSSVA